MHVLQLCQMLWWTPCSFPPGPAPVEAVRLLHRLGLFNCVFSLPALESRLGTSYGAPCCATMAAADMVVRALGLEVCMLPWPEVLSVRTYRMQYHEIAIKSGGYASRQAAGSAALRMTARRRSMDDKEMKHTRQSKPINHIALAAALAQGLQTFTESQCDAILFGLCQYKL